MDSTISAQDVTVTLGGHRILEHLSFTVKSGEIVAIIGPNGAGKSTLVKALLGFLPYEGKITILGRSPSQLRTIPTKIGYVPQRLDFDRTMPITVSELLAIHLLHPRTERIKSVLSLVGADSLANRRLGVLSGGEFQRILIALALLNEPEILFLDEPAAGIDMEGSHEMYSIVNSLQEKQGLTTILVSHDVDVVFRYATNVLCINHRLICSGIPIEALTKDTLEELYGAHHSLYPHTDNHYG